MPFPVIAVLMGGVSPEHEVSLESGRAVVAALAELGAGPAIEVLLNRDRTWQVGNGPTLDPEAAIKTFRRKCVGCCFLALHGGGGEDGSLQGFLETMGLVYTGSGVRASALAMSKVLTRSVLGGEGFPIARGCAFRVGLPPESSWNGRADLRFPGFLKEDLSGSSLGVFRVPDPETLTSLLAGMTPGSLVVFEEAVPGLEASVGVLGNQSVPREALVALPPVEIRTRRPFFDYEAKYRPDLTEETCPPREATPQQVALLQDLACRVHRCLGCDGASRTDFILGPQGPVILECNTLPGLTKASLLPLAARAAGWSFPQLVGRLVELAFEARGRTW